MAQDRIQSDILPLTHEFLSLMLGVRRPGVTVALKALRERGLISYRRGEITIKNRKGLARRWRGLRHSRVRISATDRLGSGRASASSRVKSI